MDVENILSVDIDDGTLNAIMYEHNSDIDNYDSLKIQICSDVVQCYVEDARAKYTAAVGAIQEIQDSLAKATRKRDECVAELQQLKNSQQDRSTSLNYSLLTCSATLDEMI